MTLLYIYSAGALIFAVQFGFAFLYALRTTYTFKEKLKGLFYYLFGVLLWPIWVVLFIFDWIRRFKHG